MGETVPVNIPKSELMNIYMAFFRDQIRECDVADEGADEYTYTQGTGGSRTIPPQWYVLQYKINYFTIACRPIFG